MGSSSLSAERVAPRDRERLGFLDGIRGCAALAVAVQHTVDEAYPKYQIWSVKYFGLGTFGVVAFFVVSGFIIPASLERNPSFWRFWRGRFWRLYPLYWLSLALVGVAFAFGHFALPLFAKAHPIRFVLANATMLQEYLGVPNAIDVYWTLALELAFYGICSMLAVAGVLKYAERSAWAALALFLVAILGAALFHRSIPAGRIGLIVTAFAGSILYRYYRGNVSLAVLRRVWLALFVVLAIGFVFRFRVFPNTNRELDWGLTSVLTSWGGAFAFVLIAFDRIRFPHAIRCLGRISYSLYLLHRVVIAAMPGAHKGVAWVVITLAASIVVSGATYRYVEEPLMRRGRGPRSVPEARAYAA